MAARSKNSNEEFDAEQRHLIVAAIDPLMVRTWLIKRIAERALEIIAAEEKADEPLQED